MSDSSAKDERSAAQEPVAALETHHFWVASYPFFTSTLFVTPSLAHCSENLDVRSEIEIYDPDGEVVNQIVFQFPGNQIGVVELEQFMAAAKLESGLKHAHVVVRLSEGSRVVNRIHSRESAALMGEPFAVRKDLAGFAPVTFSSSRSTLVCLVNYSTEKAAIRCRLCVGKRLPEMTCEVPAMGCRTISLEAEFPEFCCENSDELTAYLRFSTKDPRGFGVQLMECQRLTSNQNSRVNLYNSIS